MALSDRKGTVLSIEEQVHLLHEKFQYPSDDIRSWLCRAPFRDVEKALLYAWMAQCSPEKVLDMRKREPWTRILKHMDLTPDRWQARWNDFCADRLHRWWGVNEKQALRLLKAGWPMHYVKMASLLSHHLSMDMETILRQRTRECRWKEWAVHRMGMDSAVYDRMMKAGRNPSLPMQKKSGAAERNGSL